MQQFTPEEIRFVKAMKAKAFYNDLKSLFNKYEAYQDDFGGIKTIKTVIKLIEGSVQKNDSPIRRQCRLGLKVIDKTSLNEFNKIRVMSLIVKPK